MKRIYVGTLLCIILSLGLLTGCDQGVARSLGGDMTLELEPGQKLEMDEEKGMETPDPNAASMAIGACSARSDIRAGLR